MSVNRDDIAALMKGIAKPIKDQIDKATAPLTDRIDKLEREIAESKANAVSDSDAMTQIEGN